MSELPVADPGLRRVSVQAGTDVVDLALPAALPVAELIPSIVDMWNVGAADPSARYRLSRLGGPAMSGSTTLAHHNIRDGTMLVLSTSHTEPAALRCDDVAEAVTVALDATDQVWGRQASRVTGAVAAACFTSVGCAALVRNGGDGVAAASSASLIGLVALVFAITTSRAYRDVMAGLTLSLISTAFAAVAGFSAVPGSACAPKVLLGAMAAAATSVLALRVTGCGTVTLTAISGVATSTAIAALVSIVTATPVWVVGSISVVIAVGLLGTAARVSIVLAGLSPQLPESDDQHPELPNCVSARATRADDWLTSLTAAFASSAAVGAIVAARAPHHTGALRFGGVAFAALTGVVLLLRARGANRRRSLVLVASGISALTASLATLGNLAAEATSAFGAARPPGPALSLAVLTAALVAVALYLGFVAPTRSLSPLVRRAADFLEYTALAALVPLTCWMSSLYGAVRSISSSWL